MAVSVGTLVTATDYNTIRDLVNSVLITEYGYISSYAAPQVSVGETITSDDWSRLKHDIDVCSIHQIGETLTTDPGTLLTAEFVNQLADDAESVYINRYYAFLTQLNRDTTNAVTARTASWNSTLVHVINYSWPNSTLFNQYFKLGGRIEVELGYPVSTYTGEDLIWKDLIDTANAAFTLTNKKYTLSDYGGNKTYTAASNGIYSIDVSFIKTLGYNITATVSLTVGGGSSGMAIDVGCTLTNYCSLGNVGPYPYGVAAVAPAVQKLQGLDGGGSGGQSPTKVLSVSPSSLSYSFPAYQTSAAQTITLSNIGNTTLSVSGITYTGLSGTVTALPNYTGLGGTAVTSIGAGASKTFTLEFTSTQVQSISPTLTVSSDGGNVNVPISITVGSPAYRFDLVPSTWSVTTTTNLVRTQLFQIVPEGSYSVNSYSAVLSDYHGTLFGLNNSSSAGPRVLYDPTNIPNGTYTATITVTGSSGPLNYTTSSNISITLDVISSYNLGNWVSSSAANNSVVGASYDVINGVKYLTLGFGMGVDGAPGLANGGLSYIDVNNLGLNGDLNFDKGVALYTSTSALWYDFLNNYGVWVTANAGNPQGVEYRRIYTWTAPENGDYQWTFGCDDTGYFTVDGAIIADYRSYAGYFSEPTSGTIYFNAGQTYTFGIVMYNIPGGGDNPGGIALLFSKDNIERWSTRTPVRSSAPYIYWQEVYRIPLTLGANTYYSKNYCIKDSSPIVLLENSGLIVGYRWGDFFGTSGNPDWGSMFVVTDDGFGNLTITINPTTTSTGNSSYDTTINATRYAAYYYTNLPSVTRYYAAHQDQGPIGDGTQTYLFQGFASNGALNLVLTTYPGYNYSGGGGGGGLVAPYDPLFGQNYGYNPGNELNPFDPFNEFINKGDNTQLD